VADYVKCDNRRKNIEKNDIVEVTSPPPKPTPPTAITTANHNNNNHRTMHPRIVSAEQPEPTTQPAAASLPPQPVKLTPRTVSSTTTPTLTSVVAENAKVPDATTRRTSMSTAVADLASGMFNFQPAAKNTPAKNNIGGTTANSNCQRRDTSAPIISGTAAAVLALQSSFFNSDSKTSLAIVSNASSVESGGGGAVPDPLGPSSHQGGAHLSHQRPQHPGGASAAASASPQESPTSINSPSMPSTVPKSFPTRYSDGAPIIAGTAAAQMEAIATATAARITSITNDHSGAIAGCEDVVNAVASLGPNSVSASGGESSSPSHGFTTMSLSSMGWDTSDSVKAPLHVGATVTRRGIPIAPQPQQHKALSWVDHRARANNARVTPEDASAGQEGSSSSAVYHQVSVFSASASAQHATVTAQVHNSSATRSNTAGANAPGGGMDILAEIICHAPPMSIPGNISSSNNSYPQHHHQSSSTGIPSYQEIYQQAAHSKQQAPQRQAQHLSSSTVPSTPFSSPTMSATMTNKRVSAIPSYQEIYREMGLSPKQPPQSQAHHPDQRNASSHYSTSNYSIEEVQLPHSTNTNNHHPHGTRSRSNSTSTTASNSVTGRTMSHHYSHRTPTTLFGHVKRDDIEEGKELYTRKDLVHLGGHLAETKEVHGNMREGCDSLVVGNLERDIREADGLLWFLYSTDRSNGGGALCQSYHKKRPVRVFRSSLLGGKYAPPFLDMEDDEVDDSDVAYRYDGLYMVRAVWDVNGKETESFPVVGVDGWQTYFLTRLPKKPLEKEKAEPGLVYNFVGLQELWSSIQKMRGVRRPKKFEIPTPPVKLAPLKKGAVTGVYKDRKCPNYKRPEAVDPPKPPPPPRSKSPKNIPDEKKQRKEQEKEQIEDYSSSSEEEEIPKRQDAKEEEDDSDSDSSEQQLQHQHTPLSARTPSKVLTPRPRMNSITQPKKPSPAMNHEDDDSSDSEASTSATSNTHRIVAPSSPRQTKRKKPTPPDINKHELSNTLCSFLPKRSSAARAEAANRNMFGKKTYNKRKPAGSTPAASASTASATKTATTSAETTAAATSTSTATKRAQSSRDGTGAGAGKAAGARKRTKVSHYGYSSSSSSSQEDTDIIDESILTVGSRVLVIYKGSLFKATIRRRRFKNNKHDFLIHYDGNKRTNVHWVGLDRISEILEICVDTSSKKKKAQEQQPSAASKKPSKRKGGNNGGGKRKAPPKQEIINEEHSEKSVLAKVSHVDADDHDNASIMRTQDPTDDSPHCDANDDQMVTKETHRTGPSAEEKPNCDSVNRVASEAANGTPNEEELPEEKEPVETHHNREEVSKENPSGKKEISVDSEKENDKDKNNDKETASLSMPMPSIVKADDSMDVDNSDADKQCTKNESQHSNEVPTNVNDPKPNNDSTDEVEMAEFLADAGMDNLSPNNSKPTSENEEEDISKKPLSISNADAATATGPREPRKTVVSDVCVAKARDQPLEKKGSTATTTAPTDTTLGNPVAKAAVSTPLLKDPLQILAEEAESDTADNGEGNSDKDIMDENNSTSSSGNAKQHEQASASGESTSEVKFALGSHVYVEYRQIFYSSTILKTRRRRSATEYLVHYEGYKKSSNRWVKENALHEVNALTTQRFEEQRLIPADILYESAQSPVFSMTTRRRGKKTAAPNEEPPSSPLTNGIHSATTHKRPPPRRMRSDASESASQSTLLEDLEAGVAFLAGSMVFVEWNDALYLGKMVKKRYSGNRMEYLVSYDGYKSIHDAWVSTRKIYEVNPQTKRVFKQINSEILFPNGDFGKAPPKQHRRPPGPKRRETRKKAQDDLIAAEAVAALNGSDNTAVTANKPSSNLRNNGESFSNQSSFSSCGPSQQATTSTIDMEGIEPGVEFLPGSTLFAEYNGSLCLAKMLKKRGRGDFMEYLLQYNMKKKKKKQKNEEDEEELQRWVSTTMVYEINPQTKRMFRKLSKN